MKTIWKRSYPKHLGFTDLRDFLVAKKSKRQSIDYSEGNSHNYQLMLFAFIIFHYFSFLDYKRIADTPMIKGRKVHQTDKGIRIQLTQKTNTKAPTSAEIDQYLIEMRGNVDPKTSDHVEIVHIDVDCDLSKESPDYEVDLTDPLDLENYIDHADATIGVVDNNDSRESEKANDYEAIGFDNITQSHRLQLDHEMSSGSGIATAIVENPRNESREEARQISNHIEGIVIIVLY